MMKLRRGFWQTGNHLEDNSNQLHSLQPVWFWNAPQRFRLLGQKQWEFGCLKSLPKKKWSSSHQLRYVSRCLRVSPIDLDSWPLVIQWHRTVQAAVFWVRSMSVAKGLTPDRSRTEYRWLPQGTIDCRQYFRRVFHVCVYIIFYLCIASYYGQTRTAPLSIYSHMNVFLRRTDIL